MGKSKPSKLNARQSQHHSKEKVVLNEPAHAITLADDKNVILCAALDLKEYLRGRAQATRSEICTALRLRQDLSDLQHLAFAYAPREWGLPPASI